MLLAEACNVGLEPLVRPEIPALTGARLAWIQQSYIRADTITTANNRLVDVHAALPMTKALAAGNWPLPTGFASSFRSARYARARTLNTSAAAKA